MPRGNKGIRVTIDGPYHWTAIDAPWEIASLTGHNALTRVAIAQCGTKPAQIRNYLVTVFWLVGHFFGVAGEGL